MIQKVVNYSPEWAAGLNQNQWQVISGMGGRFEPESAAIANSRILSLKNGLVTFRVKDRKNNKTLNSPNKITK